MEKRWIFWSNIGMSWWFGDLFVKYFDLILLFTLKRGSFVENNYIPNGKCQELREGGLCDECIKGYLKIGKFLQISVNIPSKR